MDEGGFRLAAEREHVAHPAVSQQIARLEADLGERLFDRRRRSVTLTQAEHALLPHARAILAHADDASQDVAAISGLHTGRLTIGLVQSSPYPTDEIVDLITLASHVVRPTITRNLVRDSDDNRVLEAAIAGGADVIVTGDTDLLDLQTVEGVRIATPADFVHGLDP